MRLFEQAFDPISGEVRLITRQGIQDPDLAIKALTVNSLYSTLAP